MSRTARSTLFLVACSLIWGFTFVAQRLGAEHLGAYAFNAARGVLGTLALLPLVAVLDARARLSPRERSLAWRGVVAPGVFIGLMLTGGQTLQQLGIEQTTAGNASFVTGLYMVLVPLAGVLFGQRTSGFTWAGVALAVPGLFLLTWTGGGIGPGDLLVLVGTLFWTFQILGVGRVARHVDPIRLSAVQFAVMAAVSAVIAWVAEPAPFAGLVPALGAVLFAGILSTGVAFTLQVVGQRHVKASIAAMIMALEALWGAVGGALFLGERFTPAGYVGAALMMAGILLAQVPSRAEREQDAEVAAVPVPVPPATALREDV
ncbi:DMT family transporter [Propioniciclava soli]|uniref:DMT family transporter n=1 Tax=Propioniciclava soli TaxID=2775081 RepID=A0ABZ3CBJ0_9ACTN